MASDRRPTAVDVPPEETAEAVAREPLAASASTGSSESVSALDAPEPLRPRDLNPVGSKRPRSGMAAVGGGILGGLLVAATGAGLWFAGLIPQREDTVSPVAARVAALELQLRDLSAAQPASAEGTRRNAEELAARLAKLEGSAPAADPQLANRVAAAEAAVKSTSESVAALGRRVEQAAAAAAEARSRADAAATAAATVQPNAAAPSGVEANRSEIEAVKARLAAVESADKQQVEKSAVDALAARIEAVQQTIGGIDQTAKALQAGQANDVARDRAVRLAIVASALNAAVLRGEPYAAELNAAKPLASPNSLAPLEPFASPGLPSAAALARELSDLVPRLQEKAGVNAGEGGILEKLQANAARLVRVRPATEQPGDDVRTVLSRLEIKAQQSDISGALSELGKLPPDVRAPAEPWIQKAQARMAAADSGRRLTADAFAALAQLPQ
jgi:hypothetical protein